MGRETFNSLRTIQLRKHWHSREGFRNACAFSLISGGAKWLLNSRHSMKILRPIADGYNIAAQCQFARSVKPQLSFRYLASTFRTNNEAGTLAWSSSWCGLRVSRLDKCFLDLIAINIIKGKHESSWLWETRYGVNCLFGIVECTFPTGVVD